MTSWPTALLSLAAALTLHTGCGYVGDPKPPSLNMPRAPEGLRAVERGDRIIVQFTTSLQTTEDTVLAELGEIDLRIGSSGVEPFHQATWEDNARRIDAGPHPEAGPVRVATAASEWTGREVIVAVRVANPRGRWSDWSKPFRLRVIDPLRPPHEAQVANVAEGVRLSWSAAEDREGLRYRIFRRGGEEEGYVQAAEVVDTEWVDTGTEYEASYEYRIQSVAPAGERFAESELTPSLGITPVDKFPPPVPTGLTAVAGMNSIELTWDRNPAPDLASFRVYRRTGGRAEERIAAAVLAPGYSDLAVNSGTVYTYRVTAVDRLDNESEPSAPVEQEAP